MHFGRPVGPQVLPHPELALDRAARLPKPHRPLMAWRRQAPGGTFVNYSAQFMERCELAARAGVEDARRPIAHQRLLDGSDTEIDVHLVRSSQTRTFRVAKSTTATK